MCDLIQFRNRSWVWSELVFDLIESTVSLIWLRNCKIAYKVVCAPPCVRVRVCVYWAFLYAFRFHFHFHSTWMKRLSYMFCSLPYAQNTLNCRSEYCYRQNIHPFIKHDPPKQSTIFIVTFIRKSKMWFDYTAVLCACACVYVQLIQTSLSFSHIHYIHNIAITTHHWDSLNLFHQLNAMRPFVNRKLCSFHWNSSNSVNGSKSRLK